MTQKPASNDHPIAELLQQRWSPRAFTADSVTPAQLRSLLEAARWSPSGGNGQPWRFIVAPREDAATFVQLLETLVPANRVWAQHAPLLILAVAQLRRSAEKPNSHALYDLGQSVAHMSIQATALGLQAHQMAGFSVEEARERFAIPADYAPVTMIAIGTTGDAATLPADLRERELAPRTRNPQASFVFGGTWGEAANFGE